MGSISYLYYLRLWWPQCGVIRQTLDFVYSFSSLTDMRSKRASRVRVAMVSQLYLLANKSWCKFGSE